MGWGWWGGVGSVGHTFASVHSQIASVHMCPQLKFFLITLIFIRFFANISRTVRDSAKMLPLKGLEVKDRARGNRFRAKTPILGKIGCLRYSKRSRSRVSFLNFYTPPLFGFMLI